MIINYKEQVNQMCEMFAQLHRTENIVDEITYQQATILVDLCQVKRSMVITLKVLLNRPFSYIYIYIYIYIYAV